MYNFLLDTNVLIKQLRGDPRPPRLVLELAQRGSVYISTVTRTEIMAGMHPHEEDKTFTLLESLDLLIVDRTVADQAGRFIYQQARLGFKLALSDALIAATAKVENLTIVTTNVKHFTFAGVQLRPL